MKRSPPFCIALLALAIATIILRTPIAEALVLRGDDYLVRNNLRQAQMHYQRALWFDHNSTTAVDRSIYIAVLQHRRAELKKALMLATKFLERFPYDTVVRTDRGLCYLMLKEYRLALDDYRRAAAETRDRQISLFVARLQRIWKAGRR